MREEHEHIIKKVLEGSDQIHYTSYGGTLWTHFILAKSVAWFMAEKEAARLDQAGCTKVYRGPKS